MDNYSFEVTFSTVPTIDGWQEFAETFVSALNAFNAACTGPLVRGPFVCGGDGSEQTLGFSVWVDEALDDICEDLYTALMVLPNPFAHLVTWISHLAKITIQDVQGEVVPKVICHRSLLMIQDRMANKFVERTGFTARKETEDE